ncbi:class I SAM-dependent methyltransferase [Peribacillus sp. NPDC097675]|uniref:class I SAM-dependent methyltransferase n=1 Tax=Peribacillus sp. NPDC097675 TaxID=3390618 RepID=UPI003CFF4EB7
MTRHYLRESFNEHASQYDEQRRKLIPCFDDFYSIPITVLDTKNEKPHVLDIGAGTGLFSSFLKEKFPKAKLTLIDISEKMMKIAKDRFKSESDVEYLIADYTDYVFDRKYDFIISSLSIHHLTDDEKRNLFNCLYDALKPSGMFVNADQVHGQTAHIESLYKEDWANKINSSGLTLDEVEAAHERTKLDKMSTLEDQIQWLQQSGFQDVDCLYKYFNFVVLYGRKT